LASTLQQDDRDVRRFCGWVILGGLTLLSVVLIVHQTIVRSAREHHLPIVTPQANPSNSPDGPQSRRFDNLADDSRIPPQEEYVAGSDPEPPPAFVKMGDPRSVENIVSDISPNIEGGMFRWTYLKPTMRFRVPASHGQRFLMNFTINDRTFADTGPVTLSVSVNGHFLTAVRCARPSEYLLEQPVPAEWLTIADPVVVTATLDRVWTAPRDGARLGYVLLAAGFKN
jgi:hypothetical protein